MTTEEVVTAVKPGMTEGMIGHGAPGMITLRTIIGMMTESSRAASIFGGAKPVDTAAREREVEERLQKEQEKLQRQLDEPKLDSQLRERHPSQSGNSNRGPGDGGNKDHWKELDRKDGKKDQDSRPAPEPKKSEENPASNFSSASKYAALSVDGEDENEDDHTE
ncbi:eukaryotic translation initiation factor 4B isoform X1 [Sigmodon hispidus]